MADDDRTRWDDRYRHRTAPGPARSVLVDAAPVLPPAGRALDLACGPGAEAVWLAARGWQVDAVDVSGAALELGRRAADDAGVGDRIRFVQADLDAGLPAELQAGPLYDLVVAGHFRAPVVEDAVRHRLRSGGVVVTSRLSVVGRTPGGDGPDPRFLAAPGELAVFAVAAGLEPIEIREGDGETSLVARRSGQAGAPSV
jgi:SAM-dependent methyltransferase